MNNSSPLKSAFAYIAVIGIIGYGLYSFASNTFFDHGEHDIEVIVEEAHQEEQEHHHGYRHEHEKKHDYEFTYSSTNEASLVKTFTMNGSGELDVLTSGGKITTEGHNGNKVEVRAFVRKNGKVLTPSDDLMSKLEEGFDMRIEKSGSTVYAHAKRKNKMGMPWKRMSVEFHVLIPHKMACNLKTSGGSIHLSDVEGEQKLNTSGGSINISDVDGDIRANTSGGSIKVEDVDGQLNVSTSGGSIYLDDIEGDVQGRTSGGKISVEGVEGNLVDLKTSGGSIEVIGAAQSLKASTSGGSIKADVKGLKEELHLSTSGGSIRAKVPGNLGLDLDLKANSVNVDLKNFSGTAKKNYVQGEMNGGGMPVTMRTSGGSINIDFD